MKFDSIDRHASSSFVSSHFFFHFAQIGENIASDFKKAWTCIISIILLAILCCGALIGVMHRIADSFIWTAMFGLHAALAVGIIQPSTIFDWNFATVFVDIFENATCRRMFVLQPIPVFRRASGRRANYCVELDVMGLSVAGKTIHVAVP